MGKNRTQQSHGEVYESFGRNIANARINLGLSQYEAASRLGMSQSTYSGYESGTRKVPLSLIVKISELYGISPDELINGQDSRSKDGLILTSLEKEIVLRYRSLSDDGKSIVLRSLGIEEKKDSVIDSAG